MFDIFKHHAPSHPEYQGPPQPPAPWIAEWDGQSQRWFFVNQQTGERSWNFPQANQGYGGGGFQQQSYGSSNYEQQQPQAQSHAGRNAALGVAGGLAAGALLMHEGHKVEEHWDEDKARIEDRVDYDRERFDDRVQYDENRVEDFPDDAARWTGQKVQEVEDIPDDVAGWAGRKVQEVEDIPQDIDNDVDRFEDRVEGDFQGVQDSYDDGRDEQRYDDDQRDGW